MILAVQHSVMCVGTLRSLFWVPCLFHFRLGLRLRGGHRFRSIAWFEAILHDPGKLFSQAVQVLSRVSFLRKSWKALGSLTRVVRDVGLEGRRSYASHPLASSSPSPMPSLCSASRVPRLGTPPQRANGSFGRRSLCLDHDSQPRFIRHGSSH